MSGGMEEAAAYEKEQQPVNTPGETLLYVMADLQRREHIGLRKYHKVLTRKTDEDMLQHLYEELLDGAMYIRTLITQRANERKTP